MPLISRRSLVQELQYQNIWIRAIAQTHHYFPAKIAAESHLGTKKYGFNRIIGYLWEIHCQCDRP
jgi:hypothetical protein